MASTTFFSTMPGRLQASTAFIPRASRKAQLLAALLLPFFVVTTFVVVGVIKEIVVDSLPTDFVALNLVAFLVGTALVIGACASAFAWVVSGGFGLFD